jgi:hypothetical protein
MMQPKGYIAHIMNGGRVMCTATSFGTSPAAGFKDENWQKREVRRILAKKLLTTFCSDRIMPLFDENDMEQILYKLINYPDRAGGLTYVETKIGYEETEE